MNLLDLSPMIKANAYFHNPYVLGNCRFFAPIYNNFATLKCNILETFLHHAFGYIINLSFVLYSGNNALEKDNYLSHLYYLVINYKL